MKQNSYLPPDQSPARPLYASVTPAGFGLAWDAPGKRIVKGHAVNVMPLLEEEVCQYHPSSENKQPLNTIAGSRCVDR